MKEERVKKNDDLETRKRTLAKKETEANECKEKFKDFIWDVLLKQNESDFKNAFSRFRASKEKFLEQVLIRFKKSHISTETRENLRNRSHILFADKPEKCSLFTLNINSLLTTLQTITEDEVWQKVIVGNKDIPIAKLIEVFDNADWVNKGRKYMSNQICPFCQQKTITRELEQQLNSFFSGEYESDVNKVKELTEKYKHVTTQIINAFDTVLEHESGIKISGLDVNGFNAIRAAIASAFSNNISEMNIKSGEAGRKISFLDDLSSIREIKSILDAANKIIESHNTMVDNFNAERSRLVDDIWTFLVAEQKSLINKYLGDMGNFEKAKKGIANGIGTCKKELDELDERIYNAGKNITSVQPAVDEINRSLKAYGFTNFKIVPSAEQENSYQIQRMDGSLATNTLSEGEETFISFLYFLQFAKGSEDMSKVSSRKILVLDDPICSLDSTVLYIVSSMVKSLIKNVRNGVSDVEQLFILTHNVFFHKEASFVDGRTKELKDVNFWIISKDNNVSSIRSCGISNPIKTSYELLWKELKNNTSASLITTQNIMRRILENYFGILGQKIDDTIIKAFNTTEEMMICRSLISWINDGSHSIPDDLYIDSYTDSIDRYKEIFHKIFVQMGHGPHYDMMMN